MHIRKLELKDAPLMLEWMHDPNVTIGLDAQKFNNATFDSVCAFIKQSKYDHSNIHMAVCNEKDEYQGTVSLKNITPVGQAEFAIVFRSQSMGKGYSSFAMNTILNYGFNTLDLDNVFWQVYKSNTRAVRFYQKQGYTSCAPLPYMLHNYPQLDSKSANNFLWFLVKKEH